MSSPSVGYTLLPRRNLRPFLLDDRSMKDLRNLSAKKGRLMASERGEKTVTMAPNRVTVRVPNSSSSLSKHSSLVSMASSNLSMETQQRSPSRNLSSPVPGDAKDCLSSPSSTKRQLFMEGDRDVFECDAQSTRTCPSPLPASVSSVLFASDLEPCLNSSISDRAQPAPCIMGAPTTPLPKKDKPSFTIGSDNDQVRDSADCLSPADPLFNSVLSSVNISVDNDKTDQLPKSNLRKARSGIQLSTSAAVKPSTIPEGSRSPSPDLPQSPPSSPTTTASATLPRSKSSPTPHKTWSSSLPRSLSRHSFMQSASVRKNKAAVRNVLSYLFGCGSKRGINLQIKDELLEVTQEMEGLDLADSIPGLGLNHDKPNTKSTTLSVGKKKFNMDSKKGLEYLIENGLLRNTPEDVAEFLFKGEGLSKRAIGDYLGERHDFNISVLKAFVNLHEFSDMLIVQALRQFLWSFRLPGEAQKIDRMMECFAQRYCELTPQHFSTTDTCYVLSFAIIMLNTSLHNPAVKDKPSVERFIDMNRGINDGKDLPPDLLTRVYDNIKKEPFKIPEDDGDDLIHTFFNPDKEGWLWKQASGRCGRYKTWKRRWFLLKDHCLYYFEFTQDKEPKGIIPLENIQIREANDRDKHNCFELYAVNNDLIKACKTNSDGKVIEGKHTVYRMSASATEEREQWIKCIRQSIKSDTPFYSILAARRKKAQHEK